MTGERDQMKKALRALVVPKIRTLGFTGSFPHFRRKHELEHQMLMFMFNKYGGSFYLEAGRLSEAEFIDLTKIWESSSKQLSVVDLTVGHCKWNRRTRLGGAEIHNNTSHCFNFSADQFQEKVSTAKPSSHYNEIAMQLIAIVDLQVEVYFAGTT
tara:strand:- start:4676 stop:5140 length:465 start_codon:yes stop_codon:yes gene_type:complete